MSCILICGFSRVARRKISMNVPMSRRSEQNVYKTILLSIFPHFLVSARRVSGGEEICVFYSRGNDTTYKHNEFYFPRSRRNNNKMFTRRMRVDSVYISGERETCNLIVIDVSNDTTREDSDMHAHL